MAERSSVEIVVVLGLLFVGLLLLFSMFGIGMWCPMMMGGGMMGGWSYKLGAGWGFMFVGMLIPLLFISLLIIGAYYLLTSRSGVPSSDAALRILDERYAKGEIAEKQYLEMKQNLSK